MRPPVLDNGLWICDRCSWAINVDNLEGDEKMAATEAMPDRFDRALGNLTGLPDTMHTAPAVRQVVPLLGVGGTEIFIVQTWRQKDSGDTLFLQHSDRDGLHRMVIPPAITALISQQRDALATKARKAGARQAVQTRKERGIVPNVDGLIRARGKARRRKRRHPKP
jgi:hypothetical protein